MKKRVKGSLYGEWQPFLVSDPDGNQWLISKGLNKHIWILLQQKLKCAARAERWTAIILYTQGVVSQ